VGLEDGDNRVALLLGQSDVLIDQVDVWIEDGELALALAAEEVGGASGFVVEQLAEEHGGPPSRRDQALTSYQVIY
jgi:hypothetical protein